MNQQWSTRPPDEQFWTVEQLHAAAPTVRERSEEQEVPLGEFRAMAGKRGLWLRSGRLGVLRPTAWTVEQLAKRIGAPADYLQRLPTALVTRLLNHGIRERRDLAVAPLLLHQPPPETKQLPLFSASMSWSPLVLRAMTSPAYTRLWDAEITEALGDLTTKGWRVPPARPAFSGQPGTRPATEADLLRAGRFDLSVKIGDPIAPAGLYLGDRSLFAFLIQEDRRIEDGTDEGLSRGFFVWNSEVGSASFGVSMFLFRHVCGNHIVWDVEEVEEARLRHVRGAREYALELLSKRVEAYADASAKEDERRIAAAKACTLGRDEQEVLSKVLGLKLPGITRAYAQRAWATAVASTDTDGPATTAWGFAQGLTRGAQTILHANRRTVLDRSAGRIILLASHNDRR